MTPIEVDETLITPSYMHGSGLASGGEQPDDDGPDYTRNREGRKN